MGSEMYQVQSFEAIAKYSSSQFNAVATGMCWNKAIKMHNFENADVIILHLRWQLFDGNWLKQSGLGKQDWKYKSP